MPTITTTYVGDMQFEIDLGRHNIVIDVPAALGGKDRGPTPTDLFVASLGSCVAVYAAGYCERAGLDARDLSVDVSFDKAEKPSRLVNFQVRIKLPHVDVGERAQAICRIAQHCTVHETIAALGGTEMSFGVTGRARVAA